MPDQIARKRLKKRMLDRWENEGGMIYPDPTRPDEGTPTSGPEGGEKQLSASHDDSTVTGKSVGSKAASLSIVSLSGIWFSLFSNLRARHRNQRNR